MVVRIGVNIQTINEVDEMKREMHLNLFVRLAWMDYRLKYDSANESDFIVAGGDIAERIWKPDIYFPNERHGVKHELTVDNVNLRFYSDGQILLVVRYMLMLACDMSFELFPFDTQHCIVHFESVKYTQNFMELKWMYADDDTEPVFVKLSKFDLISSDLNDNCTRFYPIGTFNCLELTFFFKRQLGYHFAETYFPCIMIVCASWIGFWLEPKSAPARIALGIMSLLTIFGHGNHVKASLPPVSVLKAIDIYIMVCEFFVFATLIEFILSNYMSRKPHRHKLGKKVDRLGGTSGLHLI
uniref:Uncharacterized protein n=1 Tax=Plectus sambesii TaxID=2011161 RepID=A0A914W532_9BILA